jgi:MinD superfamily P-loop ATPase
VVINRADTGDRRVHDYCAANRIPVLAEIPDDRAVAEAYSRGQIACQAVPSLRSRFTALLEQLPWEACP